jgi:hypothetical protein
VEPDLCRWHRMYPIEAVGPTDPVHLFDDVSASDTRSLESLARQVHGLDASQIAEVLKRITLQHDEVRP